MDKLNAAEEKKRQLDPDDSGANNNHPYGRYSKYNYDKTTDGGKRPANPEDIDAFRSYMTLLDPSGQATGSAYASSSNIELERTATSSSASHPNTSSSNTRKSISKSDADAPKPSSRFYSQPGKSSSNPYLEFAKEMPPPKHNGATSRHVGKQSSISRRRAEWVSGDGEDVEMQGYRR